MDETTSPPPGRALAFLLERPLLHRLFLMHVASTNLDAAKLREIMGAPPEGDPEGETQKVLLEEIDAQFVGFMRWLREIAVILDSDADVRRCMSLARIAEMTATDFWRLYDAAN
jgi:hypothetical protein